MPMRRLLEIAATARRWRSCERGSVLPMFVVGFLSLSFFVGASVDYSRAVASKTQMHVAIDTAALMLAKNAASLSAAQLQAQATTIFNAQYRGAPIDNLSLTVTYTGGTTQSLSIQASGSIATTISNMVGVGNLAIGESSTVVLGGGPRLRVALVLDNTGSMAQSGKMAALQTATKNLIAQLQKANVNTGDVYASIIPFATDVTVDPANRNASWIDWTSWDDNNGNCSTGRRSYSRQSCSGTWTPTSHTQWSGCIMDRGDSSAPNVGNYDTNVSTPVAGTAATLFPADPQNSCPQMVMPLSNDWSGMTNAVTYMSPNGTTNQAIGLAHGWQSLVGGGPYPAPPAYDPNYKYRNVIILVSDGLNTADRWYNYDTPIDNRQALTCTNIKAAGIFLYTIQVNTGGDSTSSILQSCASDASSFFMLTTSTAIIDIFQQIGAALTQLRISN